MNLLEVPRLLEMVRGLNRLKDGLGVVVVVVVVRPPTRCLLGLNLDLPLVLSEEVSCCLTVLREEDPEDHLVDEGLLEALDVLLSFTPSGAGLYLQRVSL